MPRLSFYLSEKFLDEFLENRPRDILSVDYLAWIRLYQFLSTSYSTITLHNDPAHFAKWITEDGLIRILVDKYLQGNSDILFDKWETKAQLSAFAYYLLHSSKNELKNNLLQSGLPTLQNQDSICLERMTGYEAIPVHNGTFGRMNSWSDLKNRLLPFHSMVVVDNYLLQNSSSIVNFLKNILTQNSPFSAVTNVVLIGSTREGPFNRNRETQQTYDQRVSRALSDVKIIIQSIQRAISTHYKNNQPFTCHFIVLDDTGKFHDRLLFTNAQFLTSGNSFGNYFDNSGQVKMKSPTILNLYSYACTHSNTPWAEIGFEMLKTLRILIQRLPSDNIVGDPLNNLLLKP